jgi:predicted CxxxxCH...CXXCH cytochrome family protein
MRHFLHLLAMVMVVTVSLPGAAAATHITGTCNDCHKSGANPRTMTNVCNIAGCHDTTARGAFTADKASNAMGNHPTPPSATKQTSHFWGGVNTTQPAAGATDAPLTLYNGRAGISRNRLTCSLCHDPHKTVGNNKLLRMSPLDDLICQQCHTGFYIDNPKALKTHPIGNPTTATYDAAYTADPTPKRFKPTADVPNNAAQGITLINGYVTCRSCHAVHFADSDSSTIDSLGNVANLKPGDGHLLKADGPTRTNKSTLCQTCHTYKEHGKVGNNAAGSGAGDVQIGCLVCHSGHSFDATAPNYFVLRKSVDSGVAGYGSKTGLLYTNYPTSWAIYCVYCHGPVTGYTLRPHTLPADNDCTLCHAHNAATYSFAQGSTGTTCTGCHGAPPRTDTASNRTDGLPETGYAVGANGINYRTTTPTNQNGKNESTTPHKRHAGALETDKAPVDYAFGSGTILAACLPCHNDKEDAVSPPSPSHDKVNSNLSFQDVYFNSMVTYGGVLTPTAYSGTWTCSGIYCHSNGGKRPTTGGAKVLADFKTATTPAWPLASNNTTNIGTIVGTATECQQCHGVTVLTMGSAQKYNSQTHNKHLTKFGDSKTSCYLCHSATVDSSGVIPASARDHRTGGTHVNGTPNVVFSPSAFGGDLAAGTYAPGAAQGTCTVYCHSNAIGGPPATVPDWDVQGNIVCGSCHGITAATLTSGSHSIHIDSTKAKIKCDSCHGAGASTGTHSGHVDGAITKLSTATSCDLCHGVELASGKAWDISPTWGLNSSVDCRTCHTGANLTSYVNTAAATISVSTANNLSKPVFETGGHNKPSGTYALTGKPAGNKNCSACHTTLIALGTGHVDGLGNSKLLIGGFSCEACHTAAGGRSAEATVRVQSHGNQTAGYTKKAYNAAFTKACLACHDPHGTSNGAMVENLKTKQNTKDVSGNFAGDVVFSALTTTNSFDEADSGAGANNDDVCATCHSTALHNNRAVGSSHHEGENCTTTCHQHDGAKGGFMPNGGSACNSCHGNPPSLSDPRPPGKIGAHAAHSSVASHNVTEDKFDCDICHPGAASFTLSHGAVPLASGITNTTCANACHKSTAGDGSWTDSNGLDCTACHYWSASPTSGGNTTSGKVLSTTHNKHFDSGKVCITCHPNNGADVMAPHIHIDDHEAWILNATNDGTVLQDRGAATQDEASVNVTSWNDATNNCANAACHNPSGLANAATWGAPNAAGCNFCHSSTNPDTGKATPGSHGAHMNATGTFGITSIACTSCHPNNTLNSHLSGAVNLNGGFVYSTSLTDYTSATFGRCTTTTCHNNGKGTAVQTPVWGTASVNCSICHNNGSSQPYPATGRHTKHVANSAYVTSSCGNCHANATATSMTGATTHINGSAQTGVAITVHTAGTATCTNTCHVVDVTRGDWLDAAALACTDCHTSGKSAGGALPTSGLHTGTLTVSANTHDNTFKVTKAEVTPSGICETCHTATPSTAHKTGTLAAGEVTITATVGYTAGATPTCGPNGALVNCHDDKGAWKRRWSTTARTDATPLNECGNCHGNFDLTWTTGVGQRHSADAQLHGSHDGTNDCYICHTYKDGDTTYYNIATNHRDGTIQLNTNMSFVDDGATVHCTGCHTTPLGLADGQYSFQDTYNGDGADGGLNRWGRSIQAGPDANCNACHVANGQTHANPNESATVHAYHTGSPMSPGCNACHANSGPGGANHQNGTVNFGGTYLTTALNYPNGAFVNTNCSTANGCHNSEAGSWVADSLSACADCHNATGKILNQGGYPPTSAAHTKHINNNTYVGSTPTNDCDDCHGVGASAPSHLAAHNDGFKTVTNKVTVWNAGNGTCTNNCHTVVDGRDWTSATALACADCHAAAKLKTYLTAYPPTTAKHLLHINNNFYVPNDCADCHGVNSGNGTHTGHKNGTIENSVTYATGTQTCTITCHVANTSGDWTAGGALGCSDCHASGKIGTAPASGLHAGALTISANTHDDNFQVTKGGASTGTCITCHTATPSSAHKTGTLSGAQANFAAALNELGGATPTCGPNGALLSCHTDKGVWKRKWSLTAKNSNGTECGNCHGTFATGFTTGVLARHQTTTSGDVGGQIAANHNATDQCYTCHTYKAGDLTYYNFATQHRDNSIQLNNAVGLTDNGATVGCTGCHVATGGTADGGHEFSDATANWTRALQAGPTANCNGCHTTNGRTHLGTNESVTIHSLHEGSALFAGSCEACHANSRPGGANHNNTTVNFGGTYLTTTLNYTGADFTNTNCSTANGCHDSDVGEWAAASLGADKCTDCHASAAKVLNQLNAYPPVSGKHTVHINNNSYVGAAAASDCDACHGSNAYLGTHIGHRNGAKTVAASVSLYTSGSGTCTNTCHIANTNGDWSNGTVHLVCADCHSSAKTLNAGGEADMSTTIGPNAGQHDKHMLNTFYVSGGCVDCHGHNGAIGVADGHVNGPDVNTITFATKVSLYTVGTGVCTNTCHAIVDGRDWSSGTALNCADCHAAAGKSLYVNNSLSGYPVTSSKHARHNGAYSAYVPNTCASCHGVNAVTGAHAGHKNGVINNTVTYVSATQTCTNSCHVANTTGDWTSGAVHLACIDCHSAGKLGEINKPLPSAPNGLHKATAATAHDDSFGAGGTCTSCHTGMNIAGDLPATHVDGTKTQPNTAFGLFANYNTTNGNCTASCHRDNNQWKRKWIGVTDAAATGAPGQAVCNNCHGQYSTLTNSTGWNDGTVHFRSGSGAAENKGDGHIDASPNQCQDCHGYSVAGSHNSNAKIDFSGNGTAYLLTWGNNGTPANQGWYCATCHNQTSDDATLTTSHTFLDSLAFPSPTRATPEKIVYVTGTTTPSGSCTSCHGNATNGTYWPDSSNANTMNVKGAHPEHVQAIADKMPPTIGPGTGTLAEKNATCNYCHPGNVHGGANGTEPADVSMTDANNDGTADAETITKLKKIVGGGNDTVGIWRSTPGTCSLVACHASAPFTPHWYTDTVAPGTIADLELQANTEPGTVKLLWNAPGHDGALDGTAYRYDLRYSTASITEGNFASATQAQAPTVKRKHTGLPKNQEIIVKGLPTGTLYFAVKTYDDAGNASLISNVVSGTARTDNVAPIFWGISAVSASDHNFDITTNPDTNSVVVSWEAGRDHGHSLTTPLSYLVLWSESSLRTHFSNSGAMPAVIGTDACFSKLAPATQVTCGSVVPASNEYRIKSASTTALDYNVTGLPVGTVYNFLVRAKDPAGNIDSNRVDMMAMAKSTAYQTISLQTQLTSAAIPIASTGWTGLPGGSTSASDAPLGASYPGTVPGTFSLGANAVVVWSPATTYAVKTNVWGLNYQIKITGSTTSATTVTYQFGYLTGKAFTGLGTAKTMILARRMPIRVIKFPLSSFKGTIPAGSEPAFVLKGGANSITVTYGSTANKGGILLYNQQEYNDLPTGLGALSQSQVVDPYVGGNVYRLTWNAAVPVNAGQTVHYDVFGSINGGSTWPYVIGRNLTTNTVNWDPLGDGITGNQANVMFKVMAGDGFRTGLMVNNGITPLNADNLNHSEMVSSAFSVNNTIDVWTPAAIGSAAGTDDDLKAETRPKQGSVNLTWKAVGNDGFNHGTRATQYDIRYSTSAIPDLATFNALPVASQATNEPYPDFTGAMESYELLGLNPDAPYYVAMKVGDASGNWSSLSNVVSIQSGPKCGICHSTPPDEPATAGNHIKHGYTTNDCANCHGSAAANFNTDHQDGILYLGWKTATPVVGVVNDVAGTITYTQNSTLIYSDTVNGVGGFNQTTGGTTKIDDGTCSGFNGTNANGCHGPATPSWIAGTTLACSACHGLSTRTNDQYNRAFDATLDNGSVVPDEVKAAPAVDNHGTSTGKYVGAHLKHLNSSFRLAKGDNCKLCHNDNVHADGTVDVAYDFNVTDLGAQWTPNATGAGTPGTCAGTSETNCHGTNTPSWDSAATVACNECHGFSGKSFPVGSAPTINGGAGVIAHVSDGNIVRACTWCHVAGHPQGTVQEPLALMIPNNPLVGVAYRSSGIHLLKTINGRGPFTTEAQICWACHDAQPTKISEWGSNNDVNTGATPYNYGALFTAFGFTGPTSNWLGLGTGAYWQSGTTAFQTYKKGKIQSTHSTNPGGTSAVVWDATNKRYNETLDAVADIRCSNCHDVHNMNKAENDTVIGTPYLRGSWMGNPYSEDGAPQTGTTYANITRFGAVPRGMSTNSFTGGYFIDQNNVIPGTSTTLVNGTLDDYPTAGWTMETSAGLCILCHTNDVDNMDQKTGENLWITTTGNGHSNSALGGTFTAAVNIFDQGPSSYSGRPTPVTGSTLTTHVPNMAYQATAEAASTTGYGYRARSGDGEGGMYTPNIYTRFAHGGYDWGATVDAGTTDLMYHQFSCSKCHNPHASRLPKLLITNCLDIQHNTWDDNKSQQTAFTSATLTNVDRFAGVGERTAYYASAQNCHRYNNKRKDAGQTNAGGWNLVSPWTTANQ